MTRRYKLTAWIFSFICAFAAPLLAQEQGRTILVLDASGSMWGQIDGAAKITIAKDVIDGLLGNFPPEQQLGLTVYGHRRRGDCSDIETVVTPGAGTRGAISTAVNAIKPKGKTPLSAAVIAAAKSLRYTEERATVILVSDGKETCNLDPCAVGRQLEESGVDFTAHVIGFDVRDPAARAQLQCLAENTGGTFRSASNAEELSTALEIVSNDAPPVERGIRVTAFDGPDGALLSDGLIWTLSDVDNGTILLDQVAADAARLALPPGNYRAKVLRVADATTGSLNFTLLASGSTQFRIILPPLKPPATLDAPVQAFVGAKIPVTWSGPKSPRDIITIALPADRGRKYITYSDVDSGEPLTLQMPPKPGTYEIRYVHEQTGRILAMRTIKVMDIKVSLISPATARAGETIQIDWQGPNYERDFLSVTEPGSRGSKFINNAYTGSGNPLDLTMPATPGDYEIRYVQRQGNTVMASSPITILPVSATLSAPSSAGVGTEVTVSWVGPNYRLDLISLATPGTRASKSITYAYTKKDGVVTLQMPDTPGTYEIRYVMKQGNTVLATHAITVQ